MRLHLPAEERRKTQPVVASSQGAILLEVLLALALFVAAATVVTTALSASLASVERQKQACLALNLASSVLAEVDIGIRPSVSESAKAMEVPFEDWTAEVVVSPLEGASLRTPSMSRVEVIVRHQKSSMVQRLAQFGGNAAGDIRPADSPAAGKP